MRSRPYTTRTATPPLPAPEPSPPARGRRTSGRGTPSSRRRARLITEAPPADEAHAALLQSGPEALYRAEKARRAANVDAAALADAKRLYDEAVAETAKKRAGMRSAVVAPGARAKR